MMLLLLRTMLIVFVVVVVDIHFIGDVLREIVMLYFRERTDKVYFGLLRLSFC